MTYDAVLQAAMKARDRRTGLLTLGVASIGLSILLMCIALAETHGTNVIDYIPMFCIMGSITLVIVIFFCFSDAGKGPKSDASADILIWYVQKEIARYVAREQTELQNMIDTCNHAILSANQIYIQRQNIEKTLIALPQDSSTCGLLGIAQSEVAASLQTLRELGDQLKLYTSMQQDLPVFAKRWTEQLEAQKAKLLFIDQAPAHFDTTQMKAGIAHCLQPMFEQFALKTQSEPSESTVSN